MRRSIESEDFVDLAICPSVDVRALRVEALVGVGGVVDHLELAVAVEEAVATLHVTLVVLLLVPELSVVAESKLIQGFHEDMRGYTDVVAVSCGRAIYL